MFKLSSIPQSDLCFRILKVEVCDEVKALKLRKLFCLGVVGSLLAFSL